jgi:hypothetical protein
VSSSPPQVAASNRVRLTAEGITAGLIGGATIAVWFLILDLLRGHPLYTPSLLGTAIFRTSAALSPGGLTVSPAMVLLFTLLHGLIFIAIGEIAAALVRLAEKNANYGFGIILLLVIFLSGFLFVSMLFAADVLHALSWQAVLAGNLLAVGAMGLYFRRRHPNFRMLP